MIRKVGDKLDYIETNHILKIWNFQLNLDIFLKLKRKIQLH